MSVYIIHVPEEMRGGKEAELIVVVSLSQENGKQKLNVPLFNGRSKILHVIVLRWGHLPEDGSGQEAELRGTLFRFQNQRTEELKYRGTETERREI